MIDPPIAVVNAVDLQRLFKNGANGMARAQRTVRILQYHLHLAAALAAADPKLSPVEVQDIVFEVGKRHQFQPLRSWFGCLYEVLLGQTEGPRFCIFAALFGLPETVALIEGALARDAVPAETEQG